MLLMLATVGPTAAAHGGDEEDAIRVVAYPSAELAPRGR